MDDAYQVANDEYVSRGKNPVWKEFPWKRETTNHVVGEWIRLCVSASIDKTKRWWAPDHVYHYDAEKNYLLKTIDNILAEIRKKGAPFTFELKSEKLTSSVTTESLNKRWWKGCFSRHLRTEAGPKPFWII